MNIGFDLDGIFINSPPFIPHRVIERLYRKENAKELTYRFPNQLEQQFRRLTHVSFLRPLINENAEFLKKLAKKNTHKRYIISGRFGFLEDITQSLLKKHQLNMLFHKIDFNFKNKQPHIFKDEIIKKNNIHLFVDDDLPLLHYLADHNPKTTFLWFNKKKSGKLKKNMYAITHLSDLVTQKFLPDL